MSCMIAMLPGGDPGREIFPIPIDRMAALQSMAAAEMLLQLGLSRLEDLAPRVEPYIGVTLRTDGRPFYLSVFAPAFDAVANAAGRWSGAFFAPFGVADVVGTVECDLGSAPAMPTRITVRARLLPDAGGNPQVLSGKPRTPLVSVDWEVQGNQATRVNKCALIASVQVLDAGPHNADDIRRCVALHAPQRVFGDPRAIVSMQCGVAAACLVESIC